MSSGTFPIHLCSFLHSSRESSQGPCVCLGKKSVSSQCPQPGFISNCVLRLVEDLALHITDTKRLYFMDVIGSLYVSILHLGSVS